MKSLFWFQLFYQNLFKLLHSSKERRVDLGRCVMYVAKGIWINWWAWKLKGVKPGEKFKNILCHSTGALIITCKNLKRVLNKMIKWNICFHFRVTKTKISVVTFSVSTEIQNSVFLCLLMQKEHFSFPFSSPLLLSRLLLHILVILLKN